MQYRREYWQYGTVYFEKRNGLAGSQLEVHQLGSGRMFWGSVNGQKADVDGLWVRICYSNFGAVLKEAVLAEVVAGGDGGGGWWW